MGPEDVVLGNVAHLETDQTNLADKIVVTLVNVEEEATLKNGKHFIRNTITNGGEYGHRPVYLNLYFLFCATISSTASDDKYKQALNRLNSVIELFQSKKEFTVQNSPFFETNSLNPEVVSELRLRPELYTLTFEQINHLWGSLGGKQSPFVMYKVRLVKIQNLATQESPLIETIDTKLMERNAATPKLKTKT